MSQQPLCGATFKIYNKPSKHRTMDLKAEIGC